MTVKKEKKKDKTKSPANPASELTDARWSVVTFDECAAKNLSYEQAAQKLSELAAQKISGLCIVTDETAQRVKSKR